MARRKDKPFATSTSPGADRVVTCDACGAGNVIVDPSRALCAGCGNTMPEGEDCAICSSGAGKKKKRRHPVGVAACLNCEELLEDQDWDGVPVKMCPSCQAMQFPPGSLERVLNKLRETTEERDYKEVALEFAGRHLHAPKNKQIRASWPRPTVTPGCCITPT